jgi:hypothetical protein
MEMKTLLASALAFLCCFSAANAQSLQETISDILLPPVEHRQERIISGPRIETTTGDSHQVVVVDDKSPCVVELFEEGRTSGSETEQYKRYTRLSLDRMSEWRVDATSGPVHLWLLGAGPLMCASAISGRADAFIDFETRDLECLHISRFTIGGIQAGGGQNRDPAKIDKAIAHYRANFCKGRAF